MKIVWRAILFFVPVMVILGLVGFMLRGFSGDLMYSRGQLMTWLDAFPDIVGDWQKAVESFNPPADACTITGEPNVWGIIEYQWCTATTQNGFLSWFNAFGQCITVIITTPFKIIAWFFTLFYMPWIVE